jgi:predicted metal-dependent phosphoesterase TrpH
VEQAVAIGLTGLAITDHHSVHGYRKAQQWLENWRWNAFNMTRSAQAPILWTGMEINAELLHIEVHILAYAFDPDCGALRPYQQGGTVAGDAYRAEQVIASIHAAGGLAILAHPARYRLPPAGLIAEAARLGIDGIETYYAYTNPSPWTPSQKQMEEVWQLGTAYNLLHTCGTDTHGLNLLQRL